MLVFFIKGCLILLRKLINVLDNQCHTLQAISLILYACPDVIFFSLMPTPRTDSFPVCDILPRYTGYLIEEW